MMQSAGMQAIDEIVPTLLSSLEDDETSDTALDGLKQILRFLFCSNKGMMICCYYLSYFLNLIIADGVALLI